MHLGKKRNFEVLDAIEFLHRVCLHIPEPYEALIRYYGYYSNAARGKRKKLGLEPDLLDGKVVEVEFIDDAPSKKTCRKSWAQLIYKVYEVDPRAFWSVRIGMNKTYKLLILKEIDRRPVSNLDWDDIRTRGDATDSDEFLIKAALRAQMTTAAKQMGKGVIIFIVIAIVAGLAFFFMQ